MSGNDAESQKLLRNSIATWNQILTTKLATFTAANRGVKTTLVDTTTAFNTAIENPTQYGAPNASCFNSDGVSCVRIAHV
jgi:phospholipase/lecithinase/hemolysin